MQATPGAARPNGPPAHGARRRRAISRCAGLALAVLSLLAPSGAVGQPDLARVSGRVTGPEERPIVGAVVRVWPASTPGTVSESATGEDGRWRVIGLEPGRWQLEIEADGFFPAEGWFQVLASRPETTVEVELRSLEEVSPSFAENASTIVRWVEKGNALLEQGRPAAARAEYEKALRGLPRERRPEVLQAIARTHFMEGDADRSVERLHQALSIAPGDESLRQLFLTLLKTAGRLDEAEQLLAEAERAAAEPATEEEPGLTPATVRRPELSPLVEPAPGRTGRFRTAFAEGSPLSDPAIYRERFELSEADLRAADPAAGVYDLGAEAFELFVPEGAGAGDPHGLFVWVSPTPYGGFGNPEFERILTERKLIWIGAHDSGNARWGWYRVGLALDAVHNAQQLYAIDPARIYVAGYSGGGRIASQLTMLYPEVFTGGFFLYGCDWFEQLPVPDKPGSLWPARFAAPAKDVHERLKTSSRFVLLTGERDFNRSQTKRIWKRMRERGFEHLTYLEIPEADHYFGLPPEWLERGLEALDRALE